MLRSTLITIMSCLLYILVVNALGVGQNAEASFRKTDAADPIINAVPDSSSVRYADELTAKRDADYIIIASEPFYSSSKLKQLAEWRYQYNGFNVIVEQFEKICNFYPGIPPDASIKAFIQCAYDNWQSPKSQDGHVKYVLLVGDVEYIPAHISEITSIGEPIATDNWYVCVSGNDLMPDIMIGRFPAKNMNDLNTMIDKTIQYEQNPLRGDWCNNVLMVAGSVNISEKSLDGARERFLIPAGFNVTGISGMGRENSNNVVSELNKGQYIVEYAGHGSIDGWEIFNAQDIPKLKNDRMLPIIFSLACSTGQYDNPNKDSLAEAFIKAQNGAIAFFGASRLAVADNIALDLSEAIAQLHLYSIGEIIGHAKLKCLPNSANLELYNLMGDPALDLGAPRRTPSIPDILIASANISFSPEIPKQGEMVLIKTSIYNVGSGDANDVELEVRDGGSNGTLIDRKNLANIKAGGKVEYEIRWQTPLGIPQHNIYFKANLTDARVESYIDNNSSQKQLLVSLEANGWTKTLDDKKLSAPVAADIDRDGYKEILLQTHTFDNYNRLYILRSDGQSLSGWPKTVSCPDYDYDTKYSNTASVGPVPSVGDIDGDGVSEIVGVFFSHEIYAWKNDGTLMPGWPVKSNGYATTSPVLADLDSDGKMEVIVGTTDGQIHILRYDGTYFPGGTFSIGKKGHLFVIVADLDGDHDPEIIALNSPLPKNSDPNEVSILYAWHCNGSVVRGFPVQMRGTDSILPPVAGDLDEDGKSEVVAISTMNLDCKAYIWNFDGSLRTVCSFNPNSEVTSAIALCDIDDDGNVEIIAATSNGLLYAWNHNGKQELGWPVALPDAYWVSAPILSDINGDGRNEAVIASYGGKIYAYKSNGVPVDGWPSLLGDKTRLSTPMIVDINGDIGTELVYTSGFGIVHSLSLAGGISRDIENEWPMLLRDQNHTNYYGLNSMLSQATVDHTDNSGADTSIADSFISTGKSVRVLLGEDKRFKTLAVEPERNLLLQNYPNPFNPETWIPFKLKNEGNVKVRIFSLSGELVRELDLGYKPVGVYISPNKAAYWDGKDHHGVSVASGVYIYSINAAEFQAVRKMIIKK
jgi:hypothetical protein